MTSDPASTNFLNWFTSIPGASISPKCALTTIPGRGRCMVATTDIDEDETLVSIPRNIIFSVEKSPLHNIMGEQLDAMGPWQSLILCMIYETRPGADWAPYFGVLPLTRDQELDTLVYWQDEELEVLKGCEILQRIGKDEAEAMFRDDVMPVIQRNRNLFEGTCIDFNMLEDSVIEWGHKMASTIMAYSFDVQRPGAADADMAMDDDEDIDDVEEPDPGNAFKGMVPIADMLNADIDNNCFIVQTNTHLEVMSVSPIRKGDELLNDYGSMPQAELLRRYGYITPNYAQFDVVDLNHKIIVKAISRHAPPEVVEGMDQKVDFLLDTEVLEDIYDLDRDFKPPSELYVAIKILSLPTQEFLQLKAEDKLPESTSSSEKKEYKRILAKVIAARLEEYHPDETLESLNLPANEKSRRRMEMAREVVRGEKEVLRDLLSKLH
ncbi:SET domain-containing protein [Ascobolus immersus RN42]|uniref:N-lysine methyltransferase SETD6 n=1 Tax=Ascobolus immersus RN42 TaxID=1160509 RepID=A0A3N4IQA4_ASCIM|nr:SET domain-containing protein [Ascobolus immersus RN42]